MTLVSLNRHLLASAQVATDRRSIKILWSVTDRRQVIKCCFFRALERVFVTFYRFRDTDG